MLPIVKKNEVNLSTMVRICIQCDVWESRRTCFGKQDHDLRDSSEYCLDSSGKNMAVNPILQDHLGCCLYISTLSTK